MGKMIIGHGDIASVIEDVTNVTFFASGVSNSRCEDNREFQREFDLLLKMPQHQHLVYFSSLSIYYGSSPYVTHKKRMEMVVRAMFNSYTIIRIGNISWGKNPNTLINYLKAHPEAEIQNVYRHVIDKEEFQYWLKMIPVGVRNEMNVPGKRVWVPYLLADLAQEDLMKKVFEVRQRWALDPNEKREQLGYEGTGNDK